MSFKPTLSLSSFTFVKRLFSSYLLVEQIKTGRHIGSSLLDEITTIHVTCEYDIGRKEPITVVFWPRAWSGFTYVVKGQRIKGCMFEILTFSHVDVVGRTAKMPKEKGPHFSFSPVNPHTTTSTPLSLGLVVLPQLATTFYHLFNTIVSFKVLIKCFPFYEIISNTYPRNN